MKAEYELYGVTRCSYNIESENHLIAKFTTLHKAKSYINKSQLKNPTRGYTFKLNSLLRDYVDAYVEPTEEIMEVPVDPEYKERKNGK